MDIIICQMELQPLLLSLLSEAAACFEVLYLGL
jgi:hypothetical protein